MQQDNFFAFVNAPVKKSQGVIEYVLWKYLTRMYDTKAEEPVILSLINDKAEEMTFDKIN